MSPEPALAYLHGFASGPDSRKGTFLAQRLRARGAELHLPDLNRPSFDRLTISGALAAVDDLLATLPDRRWALVGSSLGGWIAALVAARRPDRIARLTLLCPGFDLVPRWIARAGEAAMRDWQETGFLEVNDAFGRPTRLHWGFFADAREFDPWPDPRCETLVVHGQLDDIVAPETSREFVSRRSECRRLIEVVDDHALLAEPDELEGWVVDGLGLKV